MTTMRGGMPSPTYEILTWLLSRKHASSISGTSPAASCSATSSRSSASSAALLASFSRFATEECCSGRAPHVRTLASCTVTVVPSS